MQKHRVLGIAFLALAAALTGCKSKVIMVVTPNPTGLPTDPSVLQAVEPGQILEWRAMNPSLGEFTVTFIGGSPCKNQSYSSTSGVASCEVMNQNGTLIYYQYQIQMGGVGAQARSCNGCSGVTNPPTGGSAPGSKVVWHKGGGLTPRTDYPGGLVSISCSNKTIGVASPSTPVSSIYWLGGSDTTGWTATFDSTSPCIQDGPFTAANNVCSYSNTAAPGSYTYHLINVGSCGNSTTPYAVTVPPPAP